MSEIHVSPVADVLLQTPLLRGPGAEPLQRQLLQRLRAAIWAGRLPAGCRLPGSRALAMDLAVSRNSVTAVYEQLGAEGYIEPSRQGTRVAALGRGNAPAQAGQAAGQALRCRHRAWSGGPWGRWPNGWPGCGPGRAPR